jgi:hypothetical protein
VHTIRTHAEPKVRSIKLRLALAAGAAVVVGAFGAVNAGAPVAVAAPGPGAAVGHTFSAALIESLALKQHSRSHRVTDIRKRRIE